MTFSTDFKKFISGGALAITAVMYMVVFSWMLGFIDYPLTLADSNFLDNNGEFLGSLLMYLITGSSLMIITPKKYRELGFKIFTVLALIITLMNSHIAFRIWDNTDGFLYNLQLLSFAVASLLAQSSLALLVLSVIEQWFRADFKKSILTNKKVLITIVVIATISLLVTLGYSYVGLPHDWII